jgi:hypothetical protein
MIIMKIKNEIKTSWDKITPSEEAQSRIYNQMLDKAKTPRPKKKLLLIPAAACLILALSLTIVLTYFPDIVTDPADPIDPGEFRGLPAQDFKVSDVMNDSFASRIPFSSMFNFFDIDWGLEDRGFVECTAVVQVTGIEDVFWRANDGIDYKYAEIVDLKVLQNIYGKPISQNIKIVQHTHLNPMLADNIYLMRVGGIYIIPLGTSSFSLTEKIYYNSGIYDVLFEIDNHGLIYSHSHINDFNRFDGRPYTVLLNELLRMSQDEATMLYVSRFGRAMRSSTLIEVVITEEGRERTNWKSYRVQVIQNLSIHDVPENINVQFDKRQHLPVEVGERYLLFVELYQEEFSYTSGNGARVLADGTIESFSVSNNVFADYDGYTTAQIKRMADLVNGIRMAEPIYRNFSGY